jgi:hypothetical protein
MIKRQWVRRYADELPSHDEQLMTLQSWDTASKGGPENDWSVCTTWILTRRLATQGRLPRVEGGREKPRQAMASPAYPR